MGCSGRPLVGRVTWAHIGRVRGWAGGGVFVCLQGTAMPDGGARSGVRFIYAVSIGHHAV